MNDAFLKACRGESVDRIPVWFMRQAGRSLPGYRALRERYGVLELTRTPELAAQVSKEPVDTHGVDAAILFADIMLLPIALGVDVAIVDAVGPVIDNPVDSKERIDELLPFSTEKIAFLAETIKILRSELSVPLIGFAGAPFTIASYLIEGKPTRTWVKTKRFMLGAEEEWHTLMGILSDAIVEYLKAQIGAGAQAVQLFDSWIGCLSPQEYRKYVAPYNERIFAALREFSVPRIFFGTNTAGMLADLSRMECDVMGVDWRIELKDAKALCTGKSLQGNLDPALLLAPWERVEEEVDRMLMQVDPKRGYIFNLGHGILPETDETIVRKLVDHIHAK